MIYVDVSTKNLPRSQDHIYELSKKFVRCSVVSDGTDLQLDATVEFSKIKSPILALILTKWRLRGYINAGHAIEYRISCR